MADTWRPATELERRLHDALRAGDQEGYFRLLADAELVVPVPSDMIDDVLANQAQPTWPTREEDGRTHVLAFTSPTAMRAGLGPAYQHFIKLKFGDMAESWPDSRWWLLIDAAQPIEGRLPGWFVKEVSAGDARPPVAGAQRALPPAREPAPAPDETSVDLPAIIDSPTAPEHLTAPEGATAPALAEHPTAEAPPGAADHRVVHDISAAVNHHPGAAPTRADHPGAAPPPDEPPPAAAQPPATQHPAATGQHAANEAPAAADQPGTAHPGTAHPGAEQTGAEQASAEQAGAEQTGAEQAGAEQASAEQTGAEQTPGAAEGPGAAQYPGSADHPAAQHPAARHVAGAPGAHGAQHPDVADQHAAHDVSTAPERQAGPEQPGAAQGAAAQASGAAAVGHGAAHHPGGTDGPAGQQVAGAPGAHAAQHPDAADRHAAHDVPTAPERQAGPEQPGLAQGDVERPPGVVEGPGDVEHPGAQRPDVADRRVAGGVPAEQVAAGGRHSGGARPAAGQVSGAEFQPANDVERELQVAAARGDQDSFVRTLVDAEVLVPIPEDMDYSLRPGRPAFPWQPREINGATMVSVFTSVERLREGAGAADFLQVPFMAVIRYWPDRRWALAVNSGTPVGASLHGEQLAALAEWADRLAAQRMSEQFEPQNEVERRLFQAAAQGDNDSFFKILMGAQVLVPADPDSPWGIRPDDPEFPWRPVPVHGRTSIQIFTSLKWMHEVIGSSRFVMPSFVDMVAAWPEAGWTLVLNPGTPIDSALPGDQTRALAGAPLREGGSPLQTRPEPEPAAESPEPAVQEPPADAGDPAEPSEVPAQAAAAGTTQPEPQAGLAPPPEQPEQAGLAPPEQPEPHARHAPPPEEPEPQAGHAPPPEQGEFKPGNRIDQELYEAAAAGDSDGFLRVLLAANVLVPIPPDAPLEVTPVEPEFRWEAALRDASSIQVFTSLVRLREAMEGARFVYADFRELIGSWPRAAAARPGEAGMPARVGEPYDWAMLLNPGTSIGASLRGDQVHALSDWAVRVGLVPPRPREPEPGQVAEPHATAPAEAPAEPRPEPDLRQPTVMQKVLPHSHVAWYLEQGYDRVGGFVHPVDDVTDLQTPLQLYEALGLLYAESPFSPADEGVYVIRWPAYCPELYRIPFGGQTQEHVDRWGDAGWVIEQEPFLGTGFAPGSAGSIREYKLDSGRLPYGAEMYLLGRDRTEQFVAMYDPDRLAWLRAEAPAGQAAGGWNDRAEAAP